MTRLVFLGTPEVGVDPLRTLVGAGHDVALVVTRADKRRGRGSELQPSPVKAAATELGLDVTDSLDDVPAVSAELGVVVAYGRIIPVSVLAHLPMVNLHFSLLPRWRGAAPVERAILEGDAETGVCLMAVEAGLDTGGIYAERETAIRDDETADELRSRLVAMGCDLLEQHLKGGVAGLPVLRDQDGQVSYAEKVLPSEYEIHWDRPALQIRRLVRLGRAWTTFRGRRVGVLTVADPPTRMPVGEDAVDRFTDGRDGGAGQGEPGALDGAVVSTGRGDRVLLTTVRPEGRRPMDAGDWLRGVRPEPDERLGA